MNSKLRLVRGLRPRTALAMRHGLFTQRIRARHGARPRTVRIQDRIFRRLAGAPVFIQHRAFASHRLAFRVNVNLARHAHYRGGDHPLAVERTFHTRAAPVVSLLTRRQRVTERLLARERRVESTTTVKDLLAQAVAPRKQSVPPRAAAFTPAPAVPMIARRPAAAASPPESVKPPAPPRPAMDDWGASVPRTRTQPAPAPIPLSPTELGRLTDHVVSALDRKFTAYRERRGSV